ncbi:MAG TPA: exodeoxyribonuclease VII large subunit [Ktedonobacterales bacterium]|nr:exodeoxyribonuclease VII large subunit [Ktedonobacterales bacterium]
MRIVAVGEAAYYLKSLLEEDPYLQDIWIRGEITNYTRSSVGHRYFSLKDEQATLKCVMFRGNADPTVDMRNGIAVVAHGRFSLYEQRGDFQFYVDGVREAGVGELHLRFEEMKARLDAEGLFALERKRALPPCPAVVGVVTSPSGAALRDILRTLRLRCPLARVILAPTLVQGAGAGEQIAEALDLLNLQGEADVIVLARGGGSLEELWAFNEEAVARAIARSDIPVVTGVGHETDFTIADFVADLRASTPTAAAAAVVPDASTWRDALDETHARLRYLIFQRIQAERDRLQSRERDLRRASPAHAIATSRQRLDEAQHLLTRAISHRMELHRARLSGAALRLDALSPLQTLGRGFAVVRRESDGALVTSVTQAPAGQGLIVRVADGTFAAIAGPRLDTIVPPDAERPERPLAQSGNQAPSRPAYPGSYPAPPAPADVISREGK